MTEELDALNQPGSDSQDQILEGKQAHVEGTNTWQVRITGKVQGVGFRDFARRTAESLGVCGWARNDDDGSVSVMLQSPETRILERVIEQLKEGPPGAQVEEVFTEQLAHESACDEFRVIG